MIFHKVPWVVNVGMIFKFGSLSFFKQTSFLLFSSSLNKLVCISVLTTTGWQRAFLVRQELDTKKPVRAGKVGDRKCTLGVYYVIPGPSRGTEKITYVAGTFTKWILGNSQWKEEIKKEKETDPCLVAEISFFFFLKFFFLVRVQVMERRDTEVNSYKEWQDKRKHRWRYSAGNSKC